MRLRVFAWPLVLAAVVPAAAFADGSPAGFPVCNVAGDQLAPVAVPSHFPGMPGSRGAMLFWQDQRGLPGDPGDLWWSRVDVPPLGDIWPVDGAAVVQRPGEQSQPAAASVTPYACYSQWGCATTVLAYADNDGVATTRTIRARRLFDQDVPWDVPVSLSTWDASEPCVVDDATPEAAGGTGAFVSWLSEDPVTHRRRLYAQHLAVDGARLWGADGLPVSGGSADQYDASMLRAPGGGAYFAWTDARFGDSTAICAMRLEDGPTPPGWPVAGRIVRTSSSMPQKPRIASDGAGSLFVLWEEMELLADQSLGLQPRIVRLLGDGSLAPGWPVEGLRVFERDDAPLRVNDLQYDGAGGLYVALTALFPAGGRVLVQRLLVDGSRPPGWPADGLEACTGPGSEGEPRLAAEEGIASVVWRDDRDGGFESDIYAARFQVDGSRPVGWPAEGLAVGQATGIQRSPVVAPGSYGGIAIAWADARDLGSSGWDVWGQTVNVAGRLDVAEGPPPGALELVFEGRQPARGFASFRLGQAIAGRVRAEVYDLAGRRLARLADGVLAAGWHTLVWRAREEAAGGAGPGVRFLRVRTEAGERTLRFVTLR